MRGVRKEASESSAISASLFSPSLSRSLPLSLILLLARVALFPSLFLTLSVARGFPSGFPVISSASAVLLGKRGTSLTEKTHSHCAPHFFFCLVPIASSVSLFSSVH